MKILIKPEEIIKRCLWDTYTHYILGTEKEAKLLLEKNEEIELTEKDALVIGLLKVIETDNLIHRFNVYLKELLNNKSTKNDDSLLIKTKIVEMALVNFLNKFPDYWTPSKLFAIALEELVIYINEFEVSLETLERTTIINNGITSEYFNANAVNKLLKFNF